jgi:hypothetical protein
MKKVALAMIAAACAFTSANAQLKPEAGSIGLGFKVSGLANVAFNNWSNTGLDGAVLPDPDGNISATGFDVAAMVPQQMMFGRYYLSSDLALRVGLGINSMSAKGSGVDSVGANLMTWEDNWSAFSLGIGAGVEKHFASAASRLDPYAGAMISYSMIGGITRDFTSNINTDPAVDVANTYEISGGSAFGIDLLAGFNYFFSDNFAVGAEMSWGYGSGSVGGDWNSTEVTTVGGTATTVNRTGNEKWSGGGFRVGSTAGVNASIFW